MKIFRLCLPVAAFTAVVSLATLAMADNNATDASTQPAAVTATTSSAISPATQPSAEDVAAAKARAAESRRKGMRSVLKGKFVEARKDFRSAGDTRALELLNQYIAKRDLDEIARKAEYDTAVRCLAQCVLAQKAIGPLAAKDDDKDESADDPDEEAADPDPAEPGSRISYRLIKKMRKHVTDATMALGEVLEERETIELATPDELKEMKKMVSAALAKAEGALKKTAGVLDGREDKYSQTLRRVLVLAQADLGAHGKAWADISQEQRQKRHMQTIELQLSMSALGDLLGEIDSMLAAKPWKYALRYGYAAKRLAVDDDHVTKQDWYKQLIADTEARGRNALSGEQWHDALTAYSHLQYLEPYNEEYKKSGKIAERHVRMLELYGKGPAQGDDTPSTNPATAEKTWKDHVKDADADMVAESILRLTGHYVDRVDYRKVIEGGLLSVKVLLETNQSANAFPGLNEKVDEDGGTYRQKMLKRIEAIRNNLRKSDRINSDDLIRTLNNVIDASEACRPPNDTKPLIPVDVLAVEYTDGFLDELDRFSSMIWPNDMEEFDKQTMGRFFGIGVQIRKAKDKPLKVVTPLAGSPAHQAGIEAGDSIVALSTDGGETWQKTSQMSIDACIKNIMGKKGTNVILRIARYGKDKPFDATVTRDEISIHTVAGWRRHNDGSWDHMLDEKSGIGYIRISQFTGTTTGDVISTLLRLRTKGVKSIIIDLRGNPGGLLRSAAGVANQFLRAGKIVSTKGRGGTLHSSPISANRSGAFLTGDLVVLVDENSASAAEIVSGALKELGRAVVVGSRTYGKGSVQNVIPIPRKRASLKLTTAHYYVGDSEKLVHRKNGATEWGVTPQVQARMTPRQIRRWQTIRSRTDLIQEIESDVLTKDLDAQFDSDIPLRTGVLLLKLRGLTSGEAHPGGAAAVVNAPDKLGAI